MSEPDIYTLLATSDLSKVPAESLLVPTDRSFYEFHSKQNASRPLSSNIKIRDIPVVKAWRQISASTSITSSTLMPIGILVLMYNQVFGLSSSHLASNPFLDRHPVSVAINSVSKTHAHRPSDIVPFAVLLGSDVLKHLVAQTAS